MTCFTVTLSIHRLVQAVLIDAMSQETFQVWVERTTHLLYAALPEKGVVTFPAWPEWEQLLPHTLTCGGAPPACTIRDH